MIDLETAIDMNEQITDFLEAQLPPPQPPAPDDVQGMWIGQDKIMTLPMTGLAWENVLATAQQDTSSPNISDQNDPTDVRVLAKALVYARTGEVPYRTEVISAIEAAVGTEVGAGILAVCRNLLSYVIAADIIGYQNVAFDSWLDAIRYQVFSGAGPSLSIIQCHEQRPNNFGTHGGAARIAIARRLEDDEDLALAAAVFKGWLGDRTSYAGFEFGDLEWQHDPDNPVGINPISATLMIGGELRNVDGVLPDDQRRDSGDPVWPPPKENYVWEALQGAIVQAELLTRAGFPAWTWSDMALLRAARWLHEEAEYPAEGDDTWQPWLFNYIYWTDFPAPLPSSFGKGMGFTDWTHG